MSGARMPPDSSSAATPRSSRPACGKAFCEPSTVLLRRALNPRPAAIANKARNARAATIQGRALVLDSRATLAIAPTAVPQRWQNFAPGLNSEAQTEHMAPASGAPQDEQYRPLADARQAGQMEVVCSDGEAMAGTYSAAAVFNSNLRLPAGGYERCLTAASRPEALGCSGH